MPLASDAVTANVADCAASPQPLAVEGGDLRHLRDEPRGAVDRRAERARQRLPGPRQRAGRGARGPGQAAAAATAAAAARALPLRCLQQARRRLRPFPTKDSQREAGVSPPQLTPVRFLRAAAPRPALPRDISYLTEARRAQHVLRCADEAAEAEAASASASASARPPLAALPPAAAAAQRPASVRAWLASLNLERYAENFERQELDLAQVALLSGEGVHYSILRDPAEPPAASCWFLRRAVMLVWPPGAPRALLFGLACRGETG